MKQLIALLGLVFITGLSYASTQPPEWLLNHQPNQATGCAVIKQGKLMAAKRIALAKARAEYLTMQKAHISSSIEMTQSNKKQDFQQTINVKTQGEAGINLLPTQQAKTTFEGVTQWCVLVSGGV